MSYKGTTRLWSNRYHFNGGVPADSTHWNTLFDAIVTAEKATLVAAVTIVEALGYAAGSDVPVATKTYSTAGTFSLAGQPVQAGDVAAMIRYSTTARTPKNHPVYLFNYYHAAVNATTSLDSQLYGSYRTALLGYASSWISGFSDGTISAVRAGPNGATATGSSVPLYANHRDFPR